MGKEAVLQLKLDKKSVDKTEEKVSTETTKNQGAENNLQSAEQSKAKIAAEAKVAAQKEANAEEEEAAAKERAVQIKNEVAAADQPCSSCEKAQEEIAKKNEIIDMQ